MLGAQNGPRIDEDPVGPRHRGAGNPVGYEHGMRDGMGPHNSPGEKTGVAAQGKRAGRVRPVLGARSGPGWKRIQWARATGLLAARWGINTG